MLTHLFNKIKDNIERGLTATSIVNNPVNATTL